MRPTSFRELAINASLAESVSNGRYIPGERCTRLPYRFRAEEHTRQACVARKEKAANHQSRVSRMAKRCVSIDPRHLRKHMSKPRLLAAGFSAARLFRLADFSRGYRNYIIISRARGQFALYERFRGRGGGGVYRFLRLPAVNARVHKGEFK